MTYKAHLVGSVPLDDAEAVFRTAATELGTMLPRIPDGETGDRTNWILWQRKFIASHPAFEEEAPDPSQYAPVPRFHLKDPDAEVSFDGGIGYAEVAVESFAVFSRLKQEGVIPESTRFQVSLPTPLAPISQFVAHEHKGLVESAYQRAMLAELDRICADIPHDELAIQWDVAIEMGMWEQLGGLFETWFSPVDQGIVDRVSTLLDATPADVEAGIHLCYGDFGHEHFTQPDDARNLVEVANRITAATSRPITWVHLPVPRDRDDEAYFAPLADLALGADTELFLGLVHLTDGVEGTERRIAAAGSAVSDFGVSTECGFGRRPPETVAPLLALHREVGQTVG